MQKEPRRNVTLHGAGMGVATEEQLENRARELAELDDRAPDEVTEEDRQRARQELRGEDLEETVACEERTTVETPQNPAETAAHHGNQAPQKKPVEEQRFTEEEVEEGIREAEHERSVRAHEEQPRSYEEPEEEETEE